MPNASDWAIDGFTFLGFSKDQAAKSATYEPEKVYNIKDII